MSAEPATDGALESVRDIELSIGGMTCAACAARVEKKLNGLGDEVIAAVNFATGRAMITAPAAVAPHTLVTAVRNAGYMAQVVRPAGEPQQHDTAARSAARPGGPARDARPGR